jgi:iodotyrosine deiodinase
VPYNPVPLEFERLSADKQLARSREFLDRMSSRRSVREFSREPVPFELIANAVAAAGTAPSGANQQPWTFVVVSDPEVKREIRLAAEDEEREAYEHRMTEEWLQALEPLGTDWRKPHIEEAPHVIVVFEQAYGLEGERRWKHYYAKESVGIAVGLLLASLHVAGLATLTHTPSPMRFLARILDRPRNERAFCLIPVGYPAEGSTVPRLEKKPLDEILISA